MISQLPKTTQVKNRFRILFYVILFLVCTFALNGCTSEEALIRSYINNLANDLSDNFQNPQDLHEENVAKLVAIGEPAVPFLITKLESPKNNRQVSWIAKTLGEIGDIRAVEPLFNAYSNPTFSGSIIEALIKIAPNDPRTLRIAIEGIDQGGSVEDITQEYLLEIGLTETDAWVEALIHGDDHAREAIKTILLSFDDPLKIEIFAGILASDDADLLAYSMDTLLELGKGERKEEVNRSMEQQIDRLGELVSFSNWEINLKAIDLLSVLHDQEAMDFLYSNLENFNLGIRAKIAIALVNNHDPRGGEVMWGLLLGNEDISDDIQPEMLDLALSTGPLPVERIIDSLLDNKTRTSWNAEFVIESTRDPEFTPYLEEIVISDPELSKKKTAIRAIGLLRLESSAPFLREIFQSDMQTLLASDTVWNLNISPDDFQSLKLSALYALGKINLESDVSFFIELLNDSNVEIQEAAYSAISYSYLPEVTTALIEICMQPENNFYFDACSKLTRHEPGNLGPLMDALETGDTAIIAKAYPFFMALGREGSESILIKALNDYGDQSMAADFLNCGNNLLEEAARAWAKDHGFTVLSTPGSSGSLSWGNP